MKNILVTGANGNLGRATISYLLKEGVAANTIYAMVRSEEKGQPFKELGVNLRIADYNDPASLKGVLENIDTLFFISSSDIMNRGTQHANFTDAIAASAVKHIVYTSFSRKNDTASSPLAFIADQHVATETWIVNSGIAYTILLNGLYADVLPQFFGENVLTQGVFYPAGLGKAAYTTREDMAEAAAKVLTGAGHENQKYVLATDENLDLIQVAAMLSEISGSEVPYHNPSVEAYMQGLEAAGVPQEYIGPMSVFGKAIEEGEFEAHSKDLEKLLNRKPTKLNTYLQQIYTTK